MLRALLFLVATGFAFAACAPSFAPLYRDYEARTPADSLALGSDALAGIRSALAEAGWMEVPSDAPNVVSTAPRVISDWGLYRTEVALDVAPINTEFVRIYFHPVRYSVLGGRTKIGYLSGGMRRALLPALNEALAARGFVVLGTPNERDEETVEG